MPDPLGRACQVPDDIGRAVTVVDVAILRSKRPDVLPRFVMYAINSRPVHRDILSLQAGGTRQRITRTNLGTIEVPIPSILEQKRIVGILDELHSGVRDLSVTLPAELAARRKQYAYYRNRLLSFEGAT
jgi:type I restriction enzyme S subunit